MKEFNKSNKITYNLMSFTGYKSLLLFEMLLESPKTYEEIRDYFKNHEYIKESISLDTLRVYITSLKRVGCNILRTKHPDGALYSLVSHPFEFKISEAQIKALAKIYRILVTTASVADVFGFECFISKLADEIRCEELSSAIAKQSIFKNLDKTLLADLLEHVKANHKITIQYNSPKSGLMPIDVIVSDIGLSQNKIYLYGISCKYNQESSYPIERIMSILDVDTETHPTVKLDYITVGYELSTQNSNIKLDDNEKIVEIRDDSIVVEACTTNLFMLKRRILEYGASCTVLYPESFRQDIINTLLNMRKGYANV